MIFRDADWADLDRMLEAQRVTAALTYDEARLEPTFAALAVRTRAAFGSPDPDHHRLRVAVVPAEPAEPAEPERAGITYAWIERRPEDVAFLVDFHVSERERGTGVAGELFDDLLAVARAWGCRRLEFRVGPDNLRAQRFFLSRGATSWPTGTTERGPLTFSLVLDDPI